MKEKSLIFKGMASQKIIAQFKISDLNGADSLLSIAEKNSIPIASSCGGEGVCRKCVVNVDQLSCLTTLSSACRSTAFKSGHNVMVTIDYL